MDDFSYSPCPSKHWLAEMTQLLPRAMASSNTQKPAVSGKKKLLDTMLRLTGGSFLVYGSVISDFLQDMVDEGKTFSTI